MIWRYKCGYIVHRQCVNCLTVGSVVVTSLHTFQGFWDSEAIYR